MKALRAVSMSALFAAFALIAIADGPINQGCPIMRGKPLKSGVTSRYAGKTVGFCCAKCKKQWDADPERYAKGFPGLADEQVVVAEIGKSAPSFKLKDTDGTEVDPRAFPEKIVVLIWLSPSDPASARIVSTGVLTKLAMDLKLLKDDLVFLPISSTERVEAKTLVKFFADHEVEMKWLIDADGKVGKSFGAKTNTTCCVIDGQGTLRFRGGIDEDPDGKKGVEARNFVYKAVKEIVDGVKVELEAPTTYGTDIKYKK